MVNRLPSGESEFRVFAPSAERVELVGSFTQWEVKPIALEPEGDGWWRAEAALNSGDHDFNYRLDGRSYQTDYAAHGVRLSEDHGWISRLHVRDHQD